MDELKRVLKEDTDLELNVNKTFVLPKDVSQQTVFDVVQNIIQVTPTLTHLSGDVLLAFFCPEGFVGIGVSIGTDSFVQNFVVKACRDIIDDIEKLDTIQDGFIHYQFLRFCQETRLQYINSHILLGNRCVLQQRHVYCKIANALFKRGTNQHTDGWDVPSKTSTHMVLHLTYDEGGFGVTFNDITNLKMMLSILLHHVLWIDLVLFLKKVRVCG